MKAKAAGQQEGFGAVEVTAEELTASAAADDGEQEKEAQA